MTNSPVPPVAPETVPDWVYAEENIISNSPLMMGEFVRNIVPEPFRGRTHLGERRLPGGGGGAVRLRAFGVLDRRSTRTARRDRHGDYEATCAENRARHYYLLGACWSLAMNSTE